MIDPIKRSKNTLPLMVQYLSGILDETNSMTNMRTRMDDVDLAYARYIRENSDASKDRSLVGTKVCGQVVNSVVNPIVISQVQSTVAHWAETFLTGYPVFGVVGPPDNRHLAEALEGIIQDHMTLSHSVPEMALMLYDGAKYNLIGWEVSWEPISTYDPIKELTDITASAATSVEENHSHINAVKRLDLRNTHYDRSCQLHEVDLKGRYAGKTERINGAALFQYLQYLEDEGKLVGDLRSLGKQLKSSTRNNADYHDPVNLSSMYGGEQEDDWSAYMGFSKQSASGDVSAILEASTKLYNMTTMYIRIRPQDFGLTVPAAKKFSMWKVVMINRSTIVYMQPYIGAYGRFAIGLAHPIEDGMGLQTQSYGEMSMPLQDATTRLMNLRLDSAKRAVQDRALYNPNMIDPAHINSAVPAAKIPVIASGLLNNGIGDAYKQIPYDSRGTENLVQDAMMIENWQKELSGMNSATKGQFSKGNRTLGEFDTIMGNSENRMKLPNIILEHRVFAKIKAAIKLNLLQFGEDTEVISPRTGQPMDLSIKELQQNRMEFEIADGYMPKGKMANTELLMSLMTMITQSPQLQEQMGYQLPSMLGHIAQLAGIRGFDRYAIASPQDAAHNATGMMATQQAMIEAIQQLQQQMGQQPMEQPAEGGEQEGEQMQ